MCAKQEKEENGDTKDNNSSRVVLSLLSLCRAVVEKDREGIRVVVKGARAFIMDTGGLSPSVDASAADQAARMDELSRMLSESSGPGQVRNKNQLDFVLPVRQRQGHNILGITSTCMCLHLRVLGYSF